MRSEPLVRQIFMHRVATARGMVRVWPWGWHLRRWPGAVMLAFLHSWGAWDPWEVPREQGVGKVHRNLGASATLDIMVRSVPLLVLGGPKRLVI